MVVCLSWPKSCSSYLAACLTWEPHVLPCTAELLLMRLGWEACFTRQDGSHNSGLAKTAALSCDLGVCSTLPGVRGSSLCTEACPTLWEKHPLEKRALQAKRSSLLPGVGGTSSSSLDKGGNWRLVVLCFWLRGMSAELTEGSRLWALCGDDVVCISSLSGLGELLRATEGAFCREKSEGPKKFLPSLPP